MRISIVMVDGSFRERFHLIESLRSQSLPSREFEVLWVEYYGSVQPALSAAIARLPNARVLTLGLTGEYHASRCFNAGVVAARHPLLFIPDADVLIGPGFLEAMVESHRSHDRLFQYYYRWNEPEDAHGPDSCTIEYLQRVSAITDPSNWGGALSVRKTWFLAVNGYDMHPVFAGGYHRNDLDLHHRLKAFGLAERWSPTQCLFHPWHPGTEGAPISHRWHHTVAAYRARHLLSLPFRGIDPASDHDIPSDLLPELAKLGWQP